MSGNTPHPLSRTGVGSGADIFQVCETTLMGAEMQILDDLLALHTFSDLYIWNWHTGRLLRHSVCDPGSWSEFDFISRQYYMMTHSSQAQILLFEIDDGSTTTDADPGVILELPEYFDSAEEKRIWTHTGPFVTRHTGGKVKPYPNSGSAVLPFMPSEESRIHVLTIELIIDRRLEPIYFFVTIKNSWLIKILKSETDRNYAARYVVWNDWGSINSHWFRTERVHSWLR
jgi:hypothetical protein